MVRLLIVLDSISVSYIVVQVMREFSDEEIIELSVVNVRFPTSKTNDGTDSVHTNPDYSVAYVTLTTSAGNHGYGITFTLGTGTDLIISTIDILKPFVLHKTVRQIFTNYRAFYRSLTQHPRMRWLGPEKGVVHLATAAITNAVWDLGARLADKPLWRFVVDLPAKDLVAMVDWSYLSDVVSEEEVVEMLEKSEEEKEKRIEYLREYGYPAYITSAGWLGYSDEKVTSLIQDKMADGWTAFKMKVCCNLLVKSRILNGNILNFACLYFGYLKYLSRNFIYNL